MATERVGVRELRQNLSRYLRRVTKGERLEVTERGKPVAVLGPVDESGSALRQLVASGRATPPEGDLLDLDSSAIVNLVVPEPETKALRALLRSWPERVSSVVARIEVERVARRIGAGTIRRARTVL